MPRPKYTPPNDAVAAEIEAALDLYERRQAIDEQRQRAQTRLREPGGVEAAIRLYSQRLAVDLELITVLSRLIEELDVPVSHLAARFGTSRKQVYRLSGKWMP